MADFTVGNIYIFLPIFRKARPSFPLCLLVRAQDNLAIYDTAVCMRELLGRPGRGLMYTCSLI